MGKRTGWEHYELEKEIGKATVSELLDIYKREYQKCSDKAIESINSRLTAEAQAEMKEEFQLLSEGCQKVATCIANTLVGIR